MNKILPLTLVLAIGQICAAQFIQRKSAIEDLNEFRGLLEQQSSYFQLSNPGIEMAFVQTKAKLSKIDSLSIYELACEFEKIISETIDRHASIKSEDFEEDEIEMFNLHFPFSIAPLNGEAVALVRNKTNRKYEYYAARYPYIKSINQLPILKFIDQYAYRRKNSPMAAKLYDGLKDIRDIGELFFKQEVTAPNPLEIVLTNGVKDSALTIALSKTKNRWNNVGHTQDKSLIRATYFDEPFDFNKLDKWLKNTTAYLQIPSMFSYSDYVDLEAYLHTFMKKYKDAKALIIDIRGNGGGTRDILNTLAGYMVQPEQSPWVANVAYIRNDQNLNEDIESMTERYLFSYYSEKLSEKDRKAIDVFLKTFKSKEAFDVNKFSQGFFMLLESNKAPIKCPIYILVDERSFSAASVFASALKGLPNVKIVGVTTNGSSGRSRSFNLKNSNIKVKLSTMISFQRNGETLDGNGTIPDITLNLDEAQVFGEKDSQLEKLLELIGTN